MKLLKNGVCFFSFNLMIIAGAGCGPQVSSDTDPEYVSETSENVGALDSIGINGIFLQCRPNPEEVARQFSIRGSGVAVDRIYSGLLNRVPDIDKSDLTNGACPYFKAMAKGDWYYSMKDISESILKSTEYLNLISSKRDSVSARAEFVNNFFIAYFHEFDREYNGAHGNDTDYLQWAIFENSDTGRVRYEIEKMLLDWNEAYANILKMVEASPSSDADYMSCKLNNDFNVGKGIKIVDQLSRALFNRVANQNDGVCKPLSYVNFEGRAGIERASESLAATTIAQNEAKSSPSNLINRLNTLLTGGSLPSDKVSDYKIDLSSDSKNLSRILREIVASAAYACYNFKEHCDGINQQPNQPPTSEKGFDVDVSNLRMTVDLLNSDSNFRITLNWDGNARIDTINLWANGTTKLVSDARSANSNSGFVKGGYIDMKIPLPPSTSCINGRATAKVLATIEVDKNGDGVRELKASTEGLAVTNVACGGGSNNAGLAQDVNLKLLRVEKAPVNGTAPACKTITQVVQQLDWSGGPSEIAGSIFLGDHFVPGTVTLKKGTPFNVRIDWKDRTYWSNQKGKDSHWSHIDFVPADPSKISRNLIKPIFLYNDGVLGDGSQCPAANQ